MTRLRLLNYQRRPRGEQRARLFAGRNIRAESAVTYAVALNQRMPVQPFRTNIPASSSEIIGRITAVQQLQDLAVAERKGFAAAGKQLGMTPSNVNHAVRLVEDRLGAPLFARSTRSVALTEAGHELFAALAPAVADMDRAWEGLSSRKGKPSGLLRINIPRVAQPALEPFIAEMARRYPDVTVELYTGDGLPMWWAKASMPVSVQAISSRATWCR
jgi:hypothetical protein